MASDSDEYSTLNKLLFFVECRDNILLHGPGGTGKSYSIRQIVEFCTEHLPSLNVFTTATTGVAAINLNVPTAEHAASTLHRWGGIGLARENKEGLLAKVRKNRDAVHRWATTDLLIIDEISMFGASLFAKLDYIGRRIRRKKDKVFGGIQLILSGDFLQLPPVHDDWVFFNQEWKGMEIVPFILTEPKRYNDTVFFELLQRVRMGRHTEKDIITLNARTKAYAKLQSILDERKDDNDIKPTILYSRRADVQSYNLTELEKLETPEVVFVADDSFSNITSLAQREVYTKLLDDAIADVITLKVGAQVMLKCNLDVERELVNGSRGVVVEINNFSVKVRFINGETVFLDKNTWELEDKHVSASRTQIPLILAWALTIHSCQGSTLDYVVCDLGHSVFADGQAYVALSRVRSIKGLFLSNFRRGSIITNRDALKYVNSLDEMQEKYFEVFQDLEE